MIEMFIPLVCYSALLRYSVKARNMNFHLVSGIGKITNYAESFGGMWKTVLILENTLVNEEISTINNQSIKLYLLRVTLNS